MISEEPTDPAADHGAWLARLRSEFPRFGILYDPGTGIWTAVRGQRLTVQAPTAFELRERLREAIGE
jgi:hypothetical protein